MSALVAYESSSEEEEVVVVAKKVPDDAKDVPITYNPANADNLQATEPINAPMVGPSFHPDASQSYEDYDEANVSETLGSEREMVRYLTQASRPMTEMPSSPPGSPSVSATARINHFLNLKAKGVHFNEDLARKSAFKNPGLLRILADRAGLDDEALYRTSLPKEIFNPTSFPAAGYKEALLKSQQGLRAKEEAEKKALSATGKRTIEFASGGTSAALSTTSLPGGLQKRRK